MCRGRFVEATRHGRLLSIVLAGIAALLGVLPATPASAAPVANAPLTSIGALLAILHDPPAIANDQFGVSVAVSGTTAIVGAETIAFRAEPGVAYIYEKGTSGWPKTPTATLADPAAIASDGFGGSVAISGTTAIVGRPGSSGGAGSAYIYEKGASGWPATPTATLADPGTTTNNYFGSSVAVSGTTAVVGAPGEGLTGAAYIYVKGASGWPATPTATLADPARTANNRFGLSVAVSASAAVVGAPGNRSSQGAAYVYKA